MKTIELNALQQIVKALGAKKDFAEKLIAAVEAEAKEAGFGYSANPPKEIDGVMNYFCRFTQAYHPESDIVMSKGKSKGYSKKAISVWNKINAEIKRMQAQISDDILNNKELNQDIVQRLEMLKSALNNPTTYADLTTALDNLGIKERSAKQDK